METPKKFRASLFGYKKKDVNAYIMESAQRFEKAKNELEKRLSDFEAEKKSLENKNSELNDKISILEKERSYIADALLNANLEAEKILSAAKTEAASIRSKLELELEDLNGEIAKEKSRIAEIRSDAQKALGEYISRLGSIDVKEEAEKVVVEDIKEATEAASPKSAPERAFEPIIADGDDLLSDIEAIDAPCQDTSDDVYATEADDDESDFEIENIES